MDSFIIFLYQNLVYVVIFTALLVFAKFIAGVVYFKGNVVDGFANFFRFYSTSNISMTEGLTYKTLKRVNNVGNVLIYILIFICVTIYYVHPDIMNN